MAHVKINEGWCFRPDRNASLKRRQVQVASVKSQTDFRRSRILQSASMAQASASNRYRDRLGRFVYGSAQSFYGRVRNSKIDINPNYMFFFSNLAHVSACLAIMIVGFLVLEECREVCCCANDFNTFTNKPCTTTTIPPYRHNTISAFPCGCCTMHRHRTSLQTTIGFLARKNGASSPTGRH